MYKNLTYLILIEQLLNQSSFLSLQLYIKGFMYCHYTFLLLITWGNENTIRSRPQISFIFCNKSLRKFIYYNLILCSILGF
nr:MAG TPA: hypothetical protein [Caudoviricetes sp.]